MKKASAGRACVIGAVFGYWIYSLLTFECVTPGYVVLALVSLLVNYDRIMRVGIRFYSKSIMPQKERIVWDSTSMHFTKGKGPL